MTPFRCATGLTIPGEQTNKCACPGDNAILNEQAVNFPVISVVSSQKVGANHGAQQKPATNPSGTQDKFHELTRKREEN
ncbi:MAG: hypothetical protein DRI37_05260 [Chloroflexi bacterium]|nr:MAG: hypothetical protein DRI37_05260 [Chloroflexota bacterium]